jgi:hypothetical protein
LTQRKQWRKKKLEKGRGKSMGGNRGVNSTVLHGKKNSCILKIAKYIWRWKQDEL